jgi:predicted alpha/beta superfamily hydrolase
LVGFAQFTVKIELHNLPLNNNTSYYLAGNFNNWMPNDTAFKFKLNNGFLVLEKKLTAKNYEYKITKGSWESVETGPSGNNIPNRSFNLNKDTLIKPVIAAWANDFKKQLKKHTASVNVSLMDSLFFIPQLNVKRRICIYLPPSYATLTKKRYPVLYLQDGQNVFDNFIGNYGEWGVDEILDSLSAKKYPECIVVAIDHGGTERLKEYNPYLSKYGEGKGKQYVDFLVKTLKPHIDKTYRTLSNKKQTSIAGSSMGGLIAMYAIATYPNVFGNAGIFSPAFWLAKTINTDVKTAAKTLQKSKIYFVAGGLEGKQMVNDMEEMYKILNPNGKNKNIQMLVKKEGKHSEWFWHSQFSDFYKFIINQ